MHRLFTVTRRSVLVLLPIKYQMKYAATHRLGTSAEEKYPSILGKSFFLLHFRRTCAERSGVLCEVSIART